MKHLLFFAAIITPVLYSMDQNTIPLEENNINNAKSSSSSPNYSTEYQYKKTLKSNDHPVTDIAFHPLESDIIISGGSNGTIKIWDIKKNIDTTLYNKNSEKIAINYNGTILASTGDNRDIIVWDFNDKTEKKTITVDENKQAHDNQANHIKCLMFHPSDQNVLISGFYGDCTIYGQSKNCVNICTVDSDSKDVITDDFAQLRGVAINPHNVNDLVLVSYKKIILMDLDKKAQRNMRNYSATAIVFNPKDDKQFITFFKGGSSVTFWDNLKFEKLKDIKLSGPLNSLLNIEDVVFDSTGKKLIVTSPRLTQIFDLEGKLIQKFDNEYNTRVAFKIFSKDRPQQQHSTNISHVRISPNDKTIITQGHEEAIKVWGCGN